MANILMFDGPDGIGKTTLVDAVHAMYADLVVPAAKLVFPSTRLKEKAKAGKSYLTSREFLLDIAGGLSSTMATHRRIICDRSFMATMAYQGCTIDTVKEYMPPFLFSGKFNSVSLFRLYLPNEALMARLQGRQGDTKIGLKGATGIADESASYEAVSRLDERFRMVCEHIVDSEPWRSNPSFRVLPIDMSDSPERCLERVLTILDSIMF